MTSISSASRSTVIKDGLNAGWPICLGYLPIGMAFGVLAQKAGLSAIQIGLMSILVFAGSAQFIAVAMLAAGASAPAIITTTFVVNLRHVLMSSALAVYLRAAHRGVLALFAYGVTDESFAVNLPRFHAHTWNLPRAMVVNHAANLVWFFSTVTGGIGGRFIPEGALGIDYALIAMFICLLVFQLRKRIHLLTALIAGLSAVGLALVIPGNSYIVIASIIAATTGVIIQRSRPGSNPKNG
ncbi:AzlC family ABC transporter permease [Desulfosarcina ovata]|uniref:Branched-chain amino acid ABC transporter permease n=2 Tax=Desulfosarcina ovata TaxID=83564 RepID=A0A5K8ACN9_9BACT|nr:AzlC family ABC transporter permease [Desulfosarcina ovata]BBO83892.1 branched-chain amino acid ABC transporter permease [Desulfosarcina ovata subsp. sediminis]BBO90385.1 branched-chain amino acid ABC transporter permease [Desulfosarcina ovata subsp. ovata]